jgi:DNA-binding GntR family transcriptional regulator
LTTAITLTTSETDLIRLRSEFLLFPGMCLTVEQAARLLDVSRDEAAGLLAMLESEGLVVHSQRGAYRSASPLLS